MEVYWADSSGRRNIGFVGLRQSLVKRFCGCFPLSAFRGLASFSSPLNEKHPAEDHAGYEQRHGTMGVLVVAALAASAEARPPGVTITATCGRTKSAASSGNRCI